MKRERKMLDDDDEEDDYDGYGHRGKRMKTENGTFLHHDQSERHHHPVSFSFFGSSDQNEDTEMHEAEESETTHISDQESIQEPPNEGYNNKRPELVSYLTRLLHSDSIK